MLHINVQRFRGGLAFKAHRLCAFLNSRLDCYWEEEKSLTNLGVEFDARSSSDKTLQSTSPQRGRKSCFTIALLCTTRRRIPESASANQGPEKGDLTNLGVEFDARGGSAVGRRHNLQPDLRRFKSDSVRFMAV